jgi:hypothetical protein
MKQTKTPRSQYSLAEASSRSEKFAAMSNLDRRAILEELENAVVQADTHQEHQAKTAVARAQCLLLALAKNLGISCDGLTTMAAQWATMGIDRLKMTREAQ